MKPLIQVIIYTLLTLAVALSQKDTGEGTPYEFGFTIDGEQHRHEKKDENGIIQGEFGFITADGVYHVTVYATDEHGRFKILSMRNIRISAPLDGSPATGPISPDADKYLKKQIQIEGPKEATRPLLPVPPQTPQPPIKSIDLPEPQESSHPPQTVTKHSGPYDFTTQPTIKPACSGCGYVTTPKPVPGQPSKFKFQNPAFQNPGDEVKGPLTTNNGAQHVPGSEQLPDNNQSQPPLNPDSNPTGIQQLLNQQYDKLSQNNEQNFQQDNENKVLEQSPSSTPPPALTNGINFNKQFGYDQQFNPQSEKVNQSPEQFKKQFEPTLGPPQQPQNDQPGGNLGDNSPYGGDVRFGHNSGIQSKDEVSKLPPISVSNNVIHVGGNKQLDIPIRDKYPGMVDGLPNGVEEKDIKDILYKFHYTVGFHGHYEKGLKNGAKIGGYFVNGRDGISRVVTYVADENGYRPKFKFINLGLDSPDTPKESTEKSFGLKSFEFVWYPIE